MIVTRKSLITGNVSTMSLDITQGQIDMYYEGALVQDAFPDLTPIEREFLLSGITQEEWEETFNDIAQGHE
jgi:hypothetical protein|tara:strand:+ start:159 stop:371 length:213 start_codon:yes stop_codon:yes gene_type:complete